MSQVLSESVATVAACQCVEHPAKPATQRQRIAMVHPTWGVVATGDEFDLDDFDRIAAECKPALVTVKAEDPTPEQTPAEAAPRFQPDNAGVLMIPVDGWQPKGMTSLPPLEVRNLSFKVANQVAAAWNRLEIENHFIHRKWHLLVCQGKKRRWGVLTIDVPRWFRPDSVSALPPGMMLQDDVPGGGRSRYRRKVNGEIFMTPGPITEWAVVVHAPMI